MVLYDGLYFVDICVFVYFVVEEVDWVVDDVVVYFVVLDFFEFYFGKRFFLVVVFSVDLLVGESVEDCLVVGFLG